MLIESLTPSQLRRTIQRLHVAKGAVLLAYVCDPPPPLITSKISEKSFKRVGMAVAKLRTAEGPTLVDHQKLLQAIGDDLQMCRESGRFRRTDYPAADRSTLEFSTLTTHLMWAESVGDNQTELERIVHSLEANPFLQRYPRWRRRCEAV